jgi:hypothetical protein
MGLLGPDKPLIQFFTQPGGLDANAENISNLDGGVGYYIRASAGKTSDWVKVYVNGEYGFVQDGKAIYPEYRDGLHCREFELVPKVPIWVGMDFGLTPAAVFAQRLANGRWLKHSEVVTDGFGAIRFGDLVHATLQERYQGFPSAASRATHRATRASRAMPTRARTSISESARRGGAACADQRSEQAPRGGRVLHDQPHRRRARDARAPASKGVAKSLPRWLLFPPHPSRW